MAGGLASILAGFSETTSLALPVAHPAPSCTDTESYPIGHPTESWVRSAELALLQLPIVITFSSIVSKMTPLCSLIGLSRLPVPTCEEPSAQAGDDDLLNAPSEGRSRRLITLSRSSPHRVERPDRELTPRQRPSVAESRGAKSETIVANLSGPSLLARTSESAMMRAFFPLA